MTTRYEFGYGYREIYRRRMQAQDEMHRQAEKRRGRLPEEDRERRCATNRDYYGFAGAGSRGATPPSTRSSPGRAAGCAMAEPRRSVHRHHASGIVGKAAESALRADPTGAVTAPRLRPGPFAPTASFMGLVGARHSPEPVDSGRPTELTRENQDQAAEDRDEADELEKHDTDEDDSVRVRLLLVPLGPDRPTATGLPRRATSP